MLNDSFVQIVNNKNYSEFDNNLTYLYYFINHKNIDYINNICALLNFIIPKKCVPLIRSFKNINTQLNHCITRIFLEERHSFFLDYRSSTFRTN